jgi:hypothetical protein
MSMTTATADIGSPAPGAAARVPIHPLWVRTTHWINALAMIVMVMSG